MAFRGTCAALVLSSLFVAGCGTVANLVKPGADGGKTPFGGVQEDEWWINEAANGECVVGSDRKSAEHPQLALMLFYAVDLPFTYVGDVLTWPYSAAYTFINE